MIKDLCLKEPMISPLTVMLMLILLVSGTMKMIKILFVLDPNLAMSWQ